MVKRLEAVILFYLVQDNGPYYNRIQRYDESGIEVRLHFKSESSSWVGVGFSFDTAMGDDDIYYCQKNQDIVSVVSAYSTGMTKPTEVENNNHFENNQVSINVAEQTFSCSFTRPLSVRKNGIGNYPKLLTKNFNLNFLRLQIR